MRILRRLTVLLVHCLDFPYELAAPNNIIVEFDQMSRGSQLGTRDLAEGVKVDTIKSPDNDGKQQSATGRQPGESPHTIMHGVVKDIEVESQHSLHGDAVDTTSTKRTFEMIYSVLSY